MLSQVARFGFMILSRRAKRRAEKKVGHGNEALKLEGTVEAIAHRPEKVHDPQTNITIDIGEKVSETALDDRSDSVPSHAHDLLPSTVPKSASIPTVLNGSTKEESQAFHGRPVAFMNGCQSLTTFLAEWIQRDAACIMLLLFVTWSSWSNCNVHLNANEVLWRHLIATAIGLFCSGIGMAVDARYFDCDLVASVKLFAAFNRSGVIHSTIGFIMAYLAMPFLAAETGFYATNLCFTSGRRPAL